MPKVVVTFGNADQIVGDQVEQEVGNDTALPLCLDLRIVPCSAPPKNAFDHRTPALGHPVAGVPRGASVDSTLAPLASLGLAVVLGDALKGAPR